MILLVSYPRSGNTFIRNVLFEVFGVRSATYHLEEHGADANWESSPVVKTHLLPEQLPAPLRSRKVVYLIRNGGDAVVSSAHHRKDVVDPESDLNQNIWETIYAADGSHFGGWGHHVEQWLPNADAVLHFEEFVADPKSAISELASLLELPDADWNRVPSFNDLKFGQPEYGSGKYMGKELAQHWFRRGQSNAWSSEMTEDQGRIFWHLHGETMEYCGYSKQGSTSEREYNKPFQFRALIEASKLSEKGFDGIKRYVYELLTASSRYKLKGAEVLAIVNGRTLGISNALALEGSHSMPSRPFWFNAAKSTAKFLFSESFYSFVAKNVSLPSGRKPQKTEYEPALKYDIVHVTLPQHWRFVQDVDRSRTIVTVHDTTHLSHPEFHLQSNVDRTAEGFAELKNTDVNCISISRSTQNDLSETGLTSKLIYEGVDRRKFFPLNNEQLLTLVNERYGLPSKFVLSLSTIEPRKNLQMLIDAYSSVDTEIRNRCHLVLAGKTGWKSKLNVPEDVKSQIHFIGFVREEHMAALYNLAHGFAFVSLYEGFGLPVLEAMACGTPTLVSDVSSLPELVGEAGIQCNPHQVDDVMDGLVKLEAMSKQEHLASCLEQSWKFSWKTCWLQTAEIYSRRTS